MFLRVTELSAEGPGLRQIARVLGISHAAVMRHLARAGRHCLLAHREMIANRFIAEPIVIDGFETFEFSQFFPYHINIAVTAQSWVLLHWTDSPLRRKGSMTSAQKIRREFLETHLGRPNPKAIEDGIIDLLLPIAVSPQGPEGPERLIQSDDHPAYRRALQRLARLPQIPRLRHQVTSSTVRRTSRNPLFPAT